MKSRYIGKPCDGFTRPACLPCPNVPLKTIDVWTTDGVEEKRLCATCVARLLPPLGQTGWAEL
jgi:hypothetical protein